MERHHRVPVCRYAAVGRCKRGDTCLFSHSLAAAVSVAPFITGLPKSHGAALTAWRRKASTAREDDPHQQKQDHRCLHEHQQQQQQRQWRRPNGDDIATRRERARQNAGGTPRTPEIPGLLQGHQTLTSEPEENAAALPGRSTATARANMTAEDRAATTGGSERRKPAATQSTAPPGTAAPSAGKTATAALAASAVGCAAAETSAGRRRSRHTDEIEVNTPTEAAKLTIPTSLVQEDSFESIGKDCSGGGSSGEPTGRSSRRRLYNATDDASICGENSPHAYSSSTTTDGAFKNFNDEILPSSTARRQRMSGAISSNSVSKTEEEEEPKQLLQERGDCTKAAALPCRTDAAQQSSCTVGVASSIHSNACCYSGGECSSSSSRRSATSKANISADQNTFPFKEYTRFCGINTTSYREKVKQKASVCQFGTTTKDDLHLRSDIRSTGVWRRKRLVHAPTEGDVSAAMAAEVCTPALSTKVWRKACNGSGIASEKERRSHLSFLNAATYSSIFTGPRSPPAEFWQQQQHEEQEGRHDWRARDVPAGRSNSDKAICPTTAGSTTTDVSLLELKQLETTPVCKQSSVVSCLLKSEDMPLQPHPQQQRQTTPSQSQTYATVATGEADAPVCDVADDGLAAIREKSKRSSSAAAAAANGTVYDCVAPMAANESLLLNSEAYIAPPEDSDEKSSSLSTVNSLPPPASLVFDYHSVSDANLRIVQHEDRLQQPSKPGQRSEQQQPQQQTGHLLLSHQVCHGQPQQLLTERTTWQQQKRQLPKDLFLGESPSCDDTDVCAVPRSKNGSASAPYSSDDSSSCSSSSSLNCNSTGDTICSSTGIGTSSSNCLAGYRKVGPPPVQLPVLLRPTQTLCPLDCLPLSSMSSLNSTCPYDAAAAAPVGAAVCLPTRAQGCSSNAISYLTFSPTAVPPVPYESSCPLLAGGGSTAWMAAAGAGESVGHFCSSHAVAAATRTPVTTAAAPSRDPPLQSSFTAICGSCVEAPEATSGFPSVVEHCQPPCCFTVPASAIEQGQPENAILLQQQKLECEGENEQLTAPHLRQQTFDLGSRPVVMKLKQHHSLVRHQFQAHLQPCAVQLTCLSGHEQIQGQQSGGQQLGQRNNSQQQQLIVAKQHQSLHQQQRHAMLEGHCDPVFGEQEHFDPQKAANSNIRFFGDQDAFVSSSSLSQGEQHVEREDTQQQHDFICSDDGLPCCCSCSDAQSCFIASSCICPSADAHLSSSRLHSSVGSRLTGSCSKSREERCSSSSQICNQHSNSCSNSSNTMHIYFPEVHAATHQSIVGALHPAAKGIEDEDVQETAVGAAAFETVLRVEEESPVQCSAGVMPAVDLQIEAHRSNDIDSCGNGNISGNRRSPNSRRAISTVARETTNSRLQCCGNKSSSWPSKLQQECGHETRYDSSQSQHHHEQQHVLQGSEKIPRQRTDWRTPEMQQNDAFDYRTYMTATANSGSEAATLNGSPAPVYVGEERSLCWQTCCSCIHTSAEAAGVDLAVDLVVPVQGAASLCCKIPECLSSGTIPALSPATDPGAAVAGNSHALSAPNSFAASSSAFPTVAAVPAYGLPLSRILPDSPTAPVSAAAPVGASLLLMPESASRPGSLTLTTGASAKSSDSSPALVPAPALCSSSTTVIDLSLAVPLIITATSADQRSGAMGTATTFDVDPQLTCCTNESQISGGLTIEFGGDTVTEAVPSCMLECSTSCGAGDTSAADSATATAGDNKVYSARTREDIKATPAESVVVTGPPSQDVSAALRLDTTVRDEESEAAAAVSMASATYGKMLTAESAFAAGRSELTPGEEGLGAAPNKQQATEQPAVFPLLAETAATAAGAGGMGLPAAPIMASPGSADVAALQHEMPDRILACASWLSVHEGTEYVGMHPYRPLHHSWQRDRQVEQRNLLHEQNRHPSLYQALHHVERVVHDQQDHEKKLQPSVNYAPVKHLPEVAAVEEEARCLPLQLREQQAEPFQTEAVPVPATPTLQRDLESLSSSYQQHQRQRCRQAHMHTLQLPTLFVLTKTNYHQLPMEQPLAAPSSAYDLYNTSGCNYAPSLVHRPQQQLDHPQLHVLQAQEQQQHQQPGNLVGAVEGECLLLARLKEEDSHAVHPNAQLQGTPHCRQQLLRQAPPPLLQEDGCQQQHVVFMQQQGVPQRLKQRVEGGGSREHVEPLSQEQQVGDALPQCEGQIHWGASACLQENFLHGDLCHCNSSCTTGDRSLEQQRKLVKQRTLEQQGQAVRERSKEQQVLREQQPEHHCPSSLAVAGEQLVAIRPFPIFEVSSRYKCCDNHSHTPVASETAAVTYDRDRRRLPCCSSPPASVKEVAALVFPSVKKAGAQQVVTVQTPAETTRTAPRKTVSVANTTRVFTQAAPPRTLPSDYSKQAIKKGGQSVSVGSEVTLLPARAEVEKVQFHARKVRQRYSQGAAAMVAEKSRALNNTTAGRSGAAQQRETHRIVQAAARATVSYIERILVLHHQLPRLLVHVLRDAEPEFYEE